MTNKTAYRTHICGELRKSDINTTVKLCGWIHNRRDHGGVLFVDLRDHYGITQIVIYPDRTFQNDIAHLAKETVIQVEGKIAHRSQENINPKMPTGEIELCADSFEILGESNALPFTVFQEEDTPEELRLKFRYLDLRRKRLHNNILLRSYIIASLRRRMNEQGFNEFQTPILTSSSPEGARDYLVPSRTHPGEFYALPQAPQQFKQLLMVGGFDRYFQIAPCFRDEDARADRSPGEFYQLDIEMSFASQDDIFSVVETVFYGLFKEFSDWEIDHPPFKRIPYKQAMLSYGTDKPDLRIALEIKDVSDIFVHSDFNAFKTVVTEKKGVVRAIPVKGIADKSRSFFDRLVDFAQSIGSQGLAYLTWTDNKIKGPVAKFLSDENIQQIASVCNVEKGDVVFFICNMEKEANRIAGEIRVKLGRDLNLVKENQYSFCWIVDFPMYEYDETGKQIIFSHNPFSMPQGGMKTLETQDPLSILAYQYDFVCNGVELSSGAIRNHKPDVMYKTFQIAGYDKNDVDQKFGALNKAFTLGAPPHGGIAPGIDRIVMLLAKEQNIREVIAFPMNQRAEDIMMSAPSEVSVNQLKEVGIKLLPK